METTVFDDNDNIMKGFKKSEEEAKKIINDPEKTSKKLEEAFVKLNGIKKGPINSLIEDIRLMIDVVKAYINGAYREIPVGTIVVILAAIIYFISPIDVIPDFLIGVGYIDDAFIIALVLKQVHEDLQSFKAWRMSQEDQI